jgi:(R)-2-hydroxyacyl-CoA dehydratese activating ATPase
MITVGIDVGSLTAKAVIWDTETRCVLGQALVDTRHDSAAAGQAVFTQALEQARKTADDITAATGTGYGRIALPFVDYRITEITCHARGVYHLLPHVQMIVDIGGQDSKVIRLDEAGGVMDFEMNDRCAAGTGRFLEVMAGALGVDLSGLVQLALGAHNPVALSSTCTVFAESEVIGLLAQGTDRADVAGGLCRSVAQRVAGMAQRLGRAERVAFTGGVALNAGVGQALEILLGVPLQVPPQPQLTGALGAALLAAERAAGEA